MIEIARYFLAWMCIGGIIANAVGVSPEPKMSSLGKALFVFLVMLASPAIVIATIASSPFRKS